jgi:cholesterol oxidase
MAARSASSPSKRPGRRVDVDVVVVGSGFGGSVSALRLTEKGYRVAVLESGRRFDDDTLPKTSWDARRFLFAPALRCFGIQRISVLKDVMVLSGAGVGGGSLVYANTLYEPLPPFYSDPQWAHITDWRDELAPYFDQAKRMLGVTENPTMTPADEVMLRVAKDMGVDDTFRRTPVGVFFGDPDDPDRAGKQVDDPFFGGAGPKRTGCTECGECMTGCRHGAKNTLLTNYLYLAEQAGAQVYDMTTVTAIRPLPDGRYEVTTRRTGSRWRRGVTYVADDVIVAAGTLGTQKLLHAMRDDGLLPHLSERLGELTRTNSEAIVGARTYRGDEDFSRGVAITSSFHPDDDTHVEPCRYGRGSNMMGLLTTTLADGDTGVARPLRWLIEVLRRPGAFLRNLSLRHWSEQTIIALVMQTRDNSITCFTKKGLFGRRLTSRQGHGEANPTWIPVGHTVVRRISQRIGGSPKGGINDVFDIPMTAHFLGGTPIGDSDDKGVIDAYHRVFGHPGLHVVDGAAISANLGVNPSLTITAQAERAMALWPNKGDADPRPEPGQPYARVAPVYPTRPVVPAGAVGELRIGLRSR